MDPVRARMALELAPYQGFPHHLPVLVGDGGVPDALSPDASLALQAAQARGPLRVQPGHALSASTPEAGGYLLPPRTV